MRRRRRYTESQKAEALALLVANGGNVNGTAKQLQIPHKTLADWRDENVRLQKQDREIKAEHAEKVGENARSLPGLTVAELRELKRGDLASAYEDIVWIGVQRLREGKLVEESSNLVAVSTATATAVDKMRLLRGESTENVAVKVEQHRWAEERLQSMMRDFDLSREEALKIVREKAPTMAAMLTA